MTYNDYDMIAQKIREGMYEGNMHACLRDVGRIAGGCLASGRITQEQEEDLKNLAASLAISKRTALDEWAKAVEYGRNEPLVRSSITYAVTENRAIGWDEVIDPEDYKIIDEKWLEREAIAEPGDDWSPCKELTDYINLLFEPTDIIAYCTDPFERDGKWIPSKGAYTKTVKEILKSLKKNTKEGFEEAVGTLNNDKSGAWIRINPFDGKGVRDENVTDYRYALIECDNKPIEEQVAIYRRLELPCVCIVHSGGKSAHAIVRVNADSLDEYRKRVNFLYEVCANNSLPVDKQNRNPSRYSRMPGAIRDGHKQYIIARNVGKSSWDEWENWIKDLNDDLPDFEPLTDEEMKDPPPLAPELIEGILRVNHKMVIVGPSKAGKSFLLIELAICVAEGLPWLGHECMKGKVLYINLELDKNSCTNRFIDVYHAMGVKPKNNANIDRWNLRGRTMPLDKLAPKLIRRASQNNYAMIIIDPIYKVLTGDENSASDMAAFCNLFDRISRDCGCAVVFCHHHSKGAQGDKKSADRASGSGVFARDPDAIMDLLPLEAASARAVVSNRYECEEMLRVADIVAYDDDWQAKVGTNDRLVGNQLIHALGFCFDMDQMDEVRKARVAARQACDAMSGWQVSLTLREFAAPKPFGVWFRYPLHFIDEENNLAACAAEGETNDYKKRKEAEPRQDKLTAFRALFELDPEKSWTVQQVMDEMEVSQRTVFNWLKKLNYTVKKGIIIRG